MQVACDAAPATKSRANARLVYPLDTAKTRIQALPHDEVEREVAEATEVSASIKEKAKGGNPVAKLIVALANKTKKMAMLAMLIRILRTEGLAGTFRGFAASMINTFSMRECPARCS